MPDWETLRVSIRGDSDLSRTLKKDEKAVGSFEKKIGGVFKKWNGKTVEVSVDADDKPLKTGLASSMRSASAFGKAASAAARVKISVDDSQFVDSMGRTRDALGRFTSQRHTAKIDVDSGGFFKTIGAMNRAIVGGGSSSLIGGFNLAARTATSAFVLAIPAAVAVAVAALQPLMGAAGVGGAAIAAVGAGFGLIALAASQTFSKIEKENGKFVAKTGETLTRSQQDLVDHLNRAGSTYARSFRGANEAANRFMGNVVQTAEQTFPYLGRLAERSTNAVAGAFADMRREMSKPGQLDSFRRLLDAAPEMSARLTRAGGNFFGGVANMLAQAVPQAKGLSGWVETTSENLLSWSRSEAGRQRLKETFQSASRFAGNLAEGTADVARGLWDISQNEGVQNTLNGMVSATGELVRKFGNLAEKGGGVLNDVFDLDVKNIAAQGGRAGDATVNAYNQALKNRGTGEGSAAYEFGHKAAGAIVSGIKAADVGGAIKGIFGNAEAGKNSALYNFMFNRGEGAAQRFGHGFRDRINEEVGKTNWGKAAFAGQHDIKKQGGIAGTQVGTSFNKSLIGRLSSDAPKKQASRSGQQVGTGFGNGLMGSFGKIGKQTQAKMAQTTKNLVSEANEAQRKGSQASQKFRTQWGTDMARVASKTNTEMAKTTRNLVKEAEEAKNKGSGASEKFRTQWGTDMTQASTKTKQEMSETKQSITTFTSEAARLGSQNATSLKSKMGQSHTEIANTTKAKMGLMESSVSTKTGQAKTSGSNAAESLKSNATTSFGNLERNTNNVFSRVETSVRTKSWDAENSSTNAWQSLSSFVSGVLSKLFGGSADNNTTGPAPENNNRTTGGGMPVGGRARGGVTGDGRTVPFWMAGGGVIPQDAVGGVVRGVSPHAVYGEAGSEAYVRLDKRTKESAHALETANEEWGRRGWLGETGHRHMARGGVRFYAYGGGPDDGTLGTRGGSSEGTGSPDRLAHGGGTPGGQAHHNVDPYIRDRANTVASATGTYWNSYPSHGELGGAVESKTVDFWGGPTVGTPIGSSAGFATANMVLEKFQSDLMYIIRQGEMWRGAWKPWPSDPHYDHTHVSWGGTGGASGSGGSMGPVPNPLQMLFERLWKPVQSFADAAFNPMKQAAFWMSRAGGQKGSQGVSDLRSWIDGRIPDTIMGSTGGGSTVPFTGDWASAKGGDPSTNRGIGQAAAKAMGWESQWGAWDELGNRESGWDRFAKNPSSGAYGIPQALPESKLPPEGQSSGGSNAGPQVAWMASYIKDRYGDPQGALSFHDANNWYEKGGVTRPHLGMSPRTEGAFKTVADALNRMVGGRENGTLRSETGQGQITRGITGIAGESGAESIVPLTRKTAQGEHALRTAMRVHHPEVRMFAAGGVTQLPWNLIGGDGHLGIGGPAASDAIAAANEFWPGANVGTGSDVNAYYNSSAASGGQTSQAGNMWIAASRAGTSLGQTLWGHEVFHAFGGGHGDGIMAPVIGAGARPTPAQQAFVEQQFGGGKVPVEGGGHSGGRSSSSPQSGGGGSGIVQNQYRPPGSPGPQTQFYSTSGGGSSGGGMGVIRNALGSWGAGGVGRRGGDPGAERAADAGEEQLREMRELLRKVDRLTETAGRQGREFANELKGTAGDSLLRTLNKRATDRLEAAGVLR
jgi:hypothetical protein